jgi:DNA segregation ATPase FtsK/SpoIIIE, S-DNA-T family
MPDRRSMRVDLFVCALFIVGLLVALSVFSYDAADPPSTSIYPSHDVATNLLGFPGAWLASRLYDAFGIAVYVLLISWFVLTLLLFLRRRFLKWILRLAGWVLLLPCVAVLGESTAQAFVSCPITGGGGSVGAWLNTWLKSRFHPIGLAAIYAGCLVVSVALTADFAVAWCLRSLWHAMCCVRDRVKPNVSVPSRERRPRLRPVQRERPPERSEPERESGSDASEGDDESEDEIEPEPQPSSVDSLIPIRHAEHSSIALHSPAPDDCRAADSATARILPIIDAVQAGEDEKFADYELPSLTLLGDPQPFPYEEHDQRLRDRAVVLEKTFTDFGLNVRVVGINAGPVVTQYEVSLETGLRVNKVTRLSDDLALNLKVPSVRIVAPIPGKNTVGIEIPNEHRAVVRLKEVILSAGPKVTKSKIPLFLGKDTEGRPLVYDLAEMPHLLIAGRTGTGKSVCMNAIILSMLVTRRPDEVKMIMIDPKMLELSEYGKIPHLMHPVVKDMKKAEAILSWAVDKMEERYDVLCRARVRSIATYNELSLEEIHRRIKPADDDERARIPPRMPYIVIFVDEMNDLMMTMKKEVEGHIIRLAQKSRAAGIHLVVATQKPTVDVITGLIKSNLPARICFQVSSRVDSRVVLDEMGADKLLGKGDMLFLQPGTSTLVRAQGTYTADEEISRVVEFLECDPCFAQELVQLTPGSAKEGKGGFLEMLRARDEVYEAAIDVVVREGRGSVSLLQRALGIGYGRAARLVDYMAEDGIVGTYNGSQARDVMYTPEQWSEVKQTGQIPKAG